MVDYQWNIFWTDLNPIKGSEQSGIRPVLVVSVEEVNQALPIVTIMAITSFKSGRKVYPTEIFLSALDTGLTKDSIVMAHQIRSISKERLVEKCGKIHKEDVREQIKNIMRVYLDL